MSFLDSITGLFTNIPKEIASAGIFSAASLISNLFGRSVEEDSMDLARDKFEQDIINSDKMLAFNREELASRERIAGASAGAAVRAAGISAGAQKQIAADRNRLEITGMRVGARDRFADRNIEAQKGRPELIMEGRSRQANMARTNASEGQRAFESLIQGIQAGLLARR